MPSAASIASTRPAATTAHCPASKSDSAPRSRAPKAMSASSSAEGARPASAPAGATRRGAISCAPTMRTPSRSKIAARPTSRPLSPRRKSCASSAARLTAPQSSLQVGEFRPRHRADHRQLGDAARLSARRTACRPRRSGPRRADRLRSPASDAPTTPIRNGSRPARRASAATSSGKRAGAAEDRERPARPPVRRPSRSRLLVLAVARDADRPVAALAQEGDDLLHRLLVGEGLGDVVDALLERPLAAQNSIL